MDHYLAQRSIVEFNYQSQGFTFSEWVALFTICLAPLIAHIIAGVPRIVYLCQTTPSWHERLGLYNPTTIVWRYFAISERCSTSQDLPMPYLALTNVVFWTPNGWDGSVETMIATRELCVQPPPPGLKRILSSDTFKTIIVALQGASALYNYAGPNQGTSAMDTIFLPLAFLGLLRLPAAIWLTSDHVIANRVDSISSVSTGSSMVHNTERAADDTVLTNASAEKSIPDAVATSSTQFQLATGILWKSICLKILFLVFFLGALALDLWLVVGQSVSQRLSFQYSATTFLLGLFYLVFVSVTAAVLLFYFARQHGPGASTVIPCMSAPWFKLYTLVLVGLAATLTVVAALEVRRQPDGGYTSWPPDQQDICLQKCQGACLG